MNQTKLKNLIKQMTLSEKIGQLIQLKGDYFLDEENTPITGPSAEINLQADTLYHIGSILNVGGAEKVKQIQDKFLAKNRLKIPLLFTGDVINGYKTIFPIPLLQGCSWDLHLIEECAKISAVEATIAGIQLNFSPMVDLVRDARWGRVLESAGGEDPYLCSCYGISMIQGYQSSGLLSCVKHFAAYGAVESGRDYNSVDMSEKELREFYLPPYQAAIQAGVSSVMTAFNTINAIPCTGNQWLLKNILRESWEFDGLILSDYSAIKELIYHGFAKDEKDAAYKAINATIDVDMMTNIYENNLQTLLEENQIQLSQIDEAVFRMLSLKNQLGLFENPYYRLDIKKEKSILLCKEHLNIARKCISDSVVLLKNEQDILPLKKEEKIALIGPYADNSAISGAWSIYNEENMDTVTLKQGIQNKLKKKEILVAKGSNILTQKEFNSILSAIGEENLTIENEDKILEEYRKEAVKIAKQADIILLAIGEHYRQSAEGGSRSNIELPFIQQALLKELSKLDKPIIAILFSGRPLVVKNIAEKVDALLWVGFPGTEGGNAIADILYGDVNPSGKLNMSFPQHVGQCPIYYNHYNTGRPHIMNSRFMSRYQDIPTSPYYPFGYGLSYSKFDYQNIKLDHHFINNDTITATVTIKNNSSIPGHEIVQLYIQDIVGSTVRPVKELKGFQKVFFGAHEEKQVSFEIKNDMLKFWNANMNFVAEPGEFKVYIGNSSTNLLCDTFYKEE